jgi:flagellar protein FliS
MYAPTARGAAAYRQTQVQCGTPLELVVKLYDAAITSMVKARDTLSRRDLMAKREAVSNALAIISELQTALDMKTGGEIAVSLDALYTYISGRILDFNTTRNVASLDEAHRLMVTLREGWQQIADGSPVPPNAP